MNYIVEKCERKEVRDFIEKWHYSHNINGITSNYCFKLMDGDIMIGAMLYGSMGMANCWKKYAESERDIIELRRLVCIDDTPKNVESYFIGKTLKWLINNTEHKIVISYADNTYNHTGIIYKASNFKHVGKTQAGRVIMYNGKRYHDKTIRTKYKGELKPFAREIKKALEDGNAHYEKTLGKEIYIYNLEERRSKKRLRRTKFMENSKQQLYLCWQNDGSVLGVATTEDEARKMCTEVNDSYLPVQADTAIRENVDTTELCTYKTAEKGFKTYYELKEDE